MKLRASASILLLTVLTLGGCGGGDDIGPLVPVEGVVTKGGKPLAGAMLTFLPNPANPTQTPGTDMTGPDGNFSAKYRNRTGLAPGKYKLVVVEGGASTSMTSPPDDPSKSPYMTQLAAGKDPNKASEESIYADPEKTPFTIDVSENGEKGQIFELK